MVPNPYLDAMVEHFGKEDDFSYRLKFGSRILALRKRFAWAIPSDQAARVIAKHATEGVLEIGAGSGYWKWFLGQHGVDILATDIGGATKARWATVAHAEVLDAEPAFAANHGGRALMLVKPNDTADNPMEREQTAYDVSFAVVAFEHYRANGGALLIHVGHPYYDAHDARVPGMSNAERILGKTYIRPETEFPAEWTLIEQLDIPTYDDKGMGSEGVFIFKRS